MSDLPVVCIFGATGVQLKSAGPIPDFETDDMDCRCYLTDNNLYETIAKDQPVAIISFGNVDKFPNLLQAPYSVRKKWINYTDMDNMHEKGSGAFNCFLGNALAKRKGIPLVTVFTPSFRTGDKIMKPYHSLLSQTYKDFEWVIVDDSDDGDKTFNMISELAKRDFRIRLYKSDRRSGLIGNVKKTACGLARGEFLVELDHDDELTPKALEYVVDAYEKHPEVGFVYTDFAECYEDGNSHMYGPGWGLGYGSYREEIHNGIKYQVVNSPRINAKTIRHIVAAPNHIRSWRKSVYDAIGGHNENLGVVDDYELLVRTFLSTRMGLVSKMCYVQFRNEGGNTTFTRNKDIQRMVRYVSRWYDKAIHERLLELGVDDFIWQSGIPSINLLGIPNPVPESHCTIMI